MPDSKILLITSNTGLSKAIESAFASMFVSLAVLNHCSKLLAQDKTKYMLILLDIDTLGSDKIAELKAFLARMSGLPVLAMCDMTRTSNKTIVDILSTGANDVIPNSIDMNVLIAKTKSHIRRIGFSNPGNDRAAENLNRQ